MKYYLCVTKGQFRTEKEGRNTYYFCSNRMGYKKKVTATWVRQNIKNIKNATIRNGRIVFVSSKNTRNKLNKSSKSAIIKKTTTILTEAEEGALLKYKSSDSYKINEKLRDNGPFEQMDYTLIRHLDTALSKLPIYNGIVYRNIWFGDKEDLVNFMQCAVIGNTLVFEGYTSTSTERDGYAINGNYVVHMIINSKTGRNVEGYGNNMENEVLFNRNMTVRVIEIRSSKMGHPILYLQEL